MYAYWYLHLRQLIVSVNKTQILNLLGFGQLYPLPYGDIYLTSDLISGTFDAR